MTKRSWRLSKTIPVTSWTAKHRWDLSLERVAIAVVGLLTAGLGEAFYIRAALGNSPWLVLGDVVSRSLSISIALASFFISLAVLLAWVPLKEKIGFGVIANAVLVAIGMQLGLMLIPPQQSIITGSLFILIACVLLGLGNAVFITCGLGPGPRQGLMTALHRLTGIRVSRLTFGHEFSAFLLGAMLGGAFGVGTFIFLILIGPAMAISFSILSGR